MKESKRKSSMERKRNRREISVEVIINPMFIVRSSIIIH